MAHSDRTVSSRALLSGADSMVDRAQGSRHEGQRRVANYRRQEGGHVMRPHSPHDDSKFTGADNYGHLHISKLQPDLVADLKEAFSICDQNNDGEISKDDLGAVMAAFNLPQTDDRLQWMIDLADLDGNGTINFVEFVTLITQNLTKEKNREVFEDAFKVFDKDGDGFIDAKELCQVLRSFGATFTQEEIFELIRNADEDGDGQINLREFIAIMQAGIFDDST